MNLFDKMMTSTEDILAEYSSPLIVYATSLHFGIYLGIKSVCLDFF